MKENKEAARRKFLRSIGLGIPTVVMGLAAVSAPAASGHVQDGVTTGEPGNLIDLGFQDAGDDIIYFRRHTLDLGISETVTIADINNDGKLDIVSGQYWYEQVSLEPERGPRFIRHKFRELPYTFDYEENLSDLAIDVNGDGYPDIVSCSYWSKPLTWWENPAGRDQPWREHTIETGSPVEFAFLVDLFNTGKPRQLLPQFGDPNFPLTWYELAAPGAANR